MAGEVSVRLDPQGKLLELQAWPTPDRLLKSASAGSADPTGPADPAQDFPPCCAAMFREAGLLAKQDAQVNPDQFVAIPPVWTAPILGDRRMAWQTTHRDTETKVRVEAATWDGSPVFFRVVSLKEGRAATPSCSAVNRLWVREDHPVHRDDGRGGVAGSSQPASRAGRSQGCVSIGELLLVLAAHFPGCCSPAAPRTLPRGPSS